MYNIYYDNTVLFMHAMMFISSQMWHLYINHTEQNNSHKIKILLANIVSCAENIQEQKIIQDLVSILWNMIAIKYECNAVSWMIMT